MLRRVIYFFWVVTISILAIYNKNGYLILVLSIFCPVVSALVNKLDRRSLNFVVENRNIKKGQNEEIKLTYSANQGTIKGKVIWKNALTGESGYKFFDSTKCCGEINVQLKNQGCGKLCFSFENLRRYDLFGITYKNMKYNITGNLYVLPELKEIILHNDEEKEYTYSDSNQLGQHFDTDHSEPDEIQLYQEGDSVKNIHWKLSFRLNELYVKRFSGECNSCYCLLIDSKCVDKALFSENLLSLSWKLIAEERPHFIATNPNESNDISLDYVEDEESFLVAQSHILSSAREVDVQSLKNILQEYNINELVFFGEDCSCDSAESVNI